MTSRESDAPPIDPIRRLLRESHLLAADQVAPVVAARAADLGFLETVIYLTDYEQVSLLPLPGPGVPPRQELSIEGMVAGLSYRRMQVAHTDRPGSGHHLWLPLLDGAKRLGVIELQVATATADSEDEARTLASLVAELVVVNDLDSDAFSRLRRRRVMTLAAEIQWDLLPPQTFATNRFVIAGALEPAYEIGGDTFDYAVTDDTADVLVLDSVGHGLPAALLASAAVGAYRHARRSQLDLPAISQAMDAVIAQQFSASQFATAAIVRLDLDTGRLRWVNAGHPAPLILRSGSLLHLPACPPARPLGLQTGKPLECETRLQPGDQVLLYTDGIIEARSPQGEFFGEDRLADFILRAAAAGDPAPETVRRLMRQVLAHQADQLQDDASIVLLEWRTGRERHLLA